jgi:hypothetical protein
MAVTEKKNIWFLDSPDGSAPPVRTYQMGASQGILMPGTPVSFDSAGQLDMVDLDEGVILGYLLGPADQSLTWPLTAAPTQGDEYRVAIARAGDTYAAYANDNASTNVDSVVAQADVGSSMAITVWSATGSVGYTTVNVASTTGTMFICTDIMFNREGSKVALADNPGIALVKHTGTLEG